MKDDIREVAKAHGPIASAHANAAPTYVHTLAENSTGGSTGPLARIANLVAAHGVGRDVVYARVRDDGYMVFARLDGQEQIVADVRYYTIDDAWNLLTGAADGQWAVRDEAPADRGLVPTCERFEGGARLFQVRWPDQWWEEACEVWADTVIRQNGLVVFARNGEVVRALVKDDVEVRQLSDAGA